jgi:DNA-binding SARP family transcriptional activator
VRFAVLGPVLVDGRPPRGAIERVLLARLLLAWGTPVPAEELIEAAWPPERRSGAASSLRVRLAKLRALLAGEAGADPPEGARPPALVREPAGYRLVVEATAVDVELFEPGRGGR